MDIPTLGAVAAHISSAGSMIRITAANRMGAVIAIHVIASRNRAAERGASNRRARLWRRA